MKTVLSFITLLTGLLLASCEPAVLQDQDFRISHPLTAQKQDAVAVFDGPILSEFDHDRLRRMAAESLRRGAGTLEITVQAPPGGEPDAKQFADSLTRELRFQGIHEITLSLRTERDASLEAIVHAPVWVAVVPGCGTFERGMNPDHANAPNSNWGCSVQRNTALMLQNPADLVRARDSSGRDANRAADVLLKYGKGQATSSDAEKQTSGSTSTVGSSK